MPAGPAASEDAEEEFYARWIAEAETHRADCPRCGGGDPGGCVHAEERLLGLARFDPRPQG
jgi:hypothetical protein